MLKNARNLMWILCLGAPLLMGKTCDSKSHTVDDNVTSGANDANQTDDNDNGSGDTAPVIVACKTSCPGPAPGAPNQICADGSTAGPTCAQNADGTCGWVFTSCPSTSSDAGPAGKFCGGLQGVACAKGEYCDFAFGTCGAADQGGTCRAIPDVCTKEYIPVCGCDGNTYANACTAASKGVSIVSKGECKQAPDPGTGTSACGTRGGVSCAKGQFCDLAFGTCGEADQGGKCSDIPQACTLQFDPVCGCDGVTYGNACEAASKGQSVRAKGECGSGSSTGCKKTPTPDPATCWTDAECGLNKKCIGAQICPCNAQCFAPDREGKCG